ncbi:hypothetical protein UFOVP190_190 [uncultured Caudovirales phage]|jgi:hypothetical protein|uniref:Uncharacterized protein n=1 Tax=uncultured Caudovirales phage TaxID=2100421 RepID=A0A6J7WH46_9CAUD|nr:hypothetical protein UFOVP190_190 [uncultured Caudovirales phage]
MVEFLLVTGLVTCCLLGPLYALKGGRMATKKPAVKKAVKKTEPVVAGQVKTDFGTFQVGNAGDITQVQPYPASVDSIANLTAPEVADKIRTGV